jgi:hypothetical protein
MSNTYKYVTATEVADILPGVNSGDVNADYLFRAEMLIDTALRYWFEGPFRKAYTGKTEFETVTLNGTSATIPSDTNKAGYYSRAVLTILETGARHYINSSTGAGVLTLDTNTGFASDTDKACTIQQFAKAPFYGDMSIVGDTYYKVIDQRIKIAVAYQYSLESRKGDSPTSTGGRIKKKEVNQTNFKVEFDNTSSSIIDLLDDKAAEILGPLMTQSM